MWILGITILGAIVFLVAFLAALVRDRDRTVARATPIDCDQTPTWNRQFQAPEEDEVPVDEARRRSTGYVCVLALTMVAAVHPLRAQESAQDPSGSAPPGATAPEQAAPTPWQYGFFVDLGYLVDINHPANHLFRSRGTTFNVDEIDVNMAAVYIKKDVSERSRWGMQLTVQAGEDSKVFGFSSVEPNLPGASFLRQLGPTNVSYLAPVGKGLTVQAGIFNSYIGYDSLYAKDNFNYTRPWGADFTPYFMMGVNVSYPVTPKLTLAGFVVNDYFHLADPNSVPSFGGQIAYKATGHWALKETLLVGPHQPDTSLEFWRFLSDSIAEWKRDPYTVAFEYQAATEQVAAPGRPQATWMAAQLPAHWQIDKHWALTVRPEVAWDSDGRWTGFPQTVKAVTGTVEYRIPYRQSNTILRAEYRFDDSRGPGGGFFRGAEIAPGVVGLTPPQHLFAFGVLFTSDGQIHH